jgi:dimeric dUTPase (all-alpha-NTP-PPase superfamily)
MSKRDKLEEMFSQQESFMKLLQKKRNFPDFPVNLETKDGQKFCKSIVYEIMGELFESLQMLKNSKDHRITNIPELNREAFVEELSDSLHYFFELAILCNITPDELFESYMKKGVVNQHRIENNY